MKKTINYQGQKYILASSFSSAEQLRVLKCEETFAIFDRYGDISNAFHGEEGVYHQGTRFLSHLEVTMGGVRLILLSSHLRHDGCGLEVDLSNAAFYDPSGQQVAAYSLHVRRSLLLEDGALRDTFLIKNYSPFSVSFPLEIEVAADYRDIFEVRGFQRTKHGLQNKVAQAADGLHLSYIGLDKVLRNTRITSRPHPHFQSEERLGFNLQLGLQEETEIVFQHRFELTSREAQHLRSSHQEEALQNLEVCKIESSLPSFDRWIERSWADLRMMITRTEYGSYPYAGVPWFSTAFGRDGIITGLQTTWLTPDLSRNILNFLSHTQAQSVCDERDSQPGKIIHEMRSGEMASLGEIPFDMYYGSVDSTPLYIILADQYVSNTGDFIFLKKIWPHIEAATAWIDRYGDTDNDGFLDYQRHTNQGLLNQAWKDSEDSVFHEGGALARGPLALCEVQAYVYAAKQAAARLASYLGFEKRALQLNKEAQNLKTLFNKTFWIPEKGTYGLALDGDKNLCRVRASNAGHCLAFGIADEKYLPDLTESLLNPHSYSGWGIRTLDNREARYNPMSYHNGSVWPHDNSIIAWGFARYGRKKEALKILEGLFEATSFVELQRLPELMCGFSREQKKGPTLYPLSCAPQSWAAGSVFLILQACLGLEVCGVHKRLILRQPQLPSFLSDVKIQNLRIGTHHTVDLQVYREAAEFQVKILKKTEGLEVQLITEMGKQIL